MALLPSYRSSVAREIGGFPMEQIEALVRSATGYNLFEEFASKNDPPVKAVSRALEQLEKEGHERWLLVKVLASSISDFPLRRLIVEACPETLQAPTSVEKYVELVLDRLNKVMALALEPTYKHELRQSRQKYADISREITNLDVYKCLHERLHTLYLCLTYKSLPVLSSDMQDDLTMLDDHAALIKKVCSAASAKISVLEEEDRKGELHWIASLEALAQQLPSSTAAQSEVSTWLSSVQRLVRLHLSRLNKRIFDTADKLSLQALFQVLPKTLRGNELSEQLAHAIHDLIATVTARAIVHKFWQDADNELSVMKDFLEVVTGPEQQLAQHWFALRAQILWLAGLDSGAEWSKEAVKYSESIDLELTTEKLGAALKPSFETYCRLLKFRFFAVDATLMIDCGSLGRFHEPLQRYAQEIGNG